MLLKTALSIACFALWTSASDVAAQLEKKADARPNIVFIFTDDQDMKMNSLDYMAGVQSNIMSQGASFVHHYCTVALCCPSRVNLWTGRAAHNTNVTALVPPYGGYKIFAERGLNNDWLPLWMQGVGYNTYYTGKLMNGFGPDNYNTPYVKGFNGSDFLCGKRTYNYYAPLFQRNQDPPNSYNMTYTTTLVTEKGLAFLDDAVKAGGPFFLTMAPVSPHSGSGYRPPNTPDFGPVPEAKYATLFNDAKVPRTANFNPDKPSGTSWLLDIDKLNETEVNRNDMYYQQRLRALQSVDDLVNQTVAALEAKGLLNNTYIFYSSDNGFHISQHRLFPGKNCPYEEDVNVPLLIRGPGIKPGSSFNASTSHTDLAATFLYIAGANLTDYPLDGAPIPGIDPNPTAENFEHVQIEHWGDAGQDDESYYPDAPVNDTTYKALRIMGPTYNFFYSVWCTNQHELYDMSESVDPYQMNNLWTNYTYEPNEPSNSSDPFPVNRLESRLNALLLVLKGCKGSNCTMPWLALHPAGNVKSLPDAMNPAYDEFYEKEQNRISFSACLPGYIKAAEGPQTFYQYMASKRRSLLV